MAAKHELLQRPCMAHEAAKELTASVSTWLRAGKPRRAAAATARSMAVPSMSLLAATGTEFAVNRETGQNRYIIQTTRFIASK